jgi:deazaflavin-dependent oxidoreductase (nitroreductase family)
MPGMGVVVHAGRKSHRVYRTPVLLFRRGNRFLVALTYGRDSEWVRNVVAQNGCELETEGRRLQLTNPYLFRDEKRHAMPGFVRFVLGLLNVSDFLELKIADSELARGDHAEKSVRQVENKKSA